MTDESERANRHCPSCGKEGIGDYADNGVDGMVEWSCTTDDDECRVSLYKVYENV